MMDSLARKHFDAIVALEVDPNSAATKVLVGDFNNSLDEMLLQFSPEDERERLRELFKANDARVEK
jgi:hypothetical protein